MKLYSKSELRYSRIFFDKKPPAYAFILIISTAFILVSSLIGAAYIPKNYIVKANGTVAITGTEFLSAVGSGMIVTMHKSEGDVVKNGDIILSFSSGQEQLQAESLSKQLEQLRAKESLFNKYEQSLKEKRNYLSNSGEEQEYYGKVEYYLSQLKSESYNDGSQYGKLQDEKEKLNKLINERNQLNHELIIAQNEYDRLQQQLSSQVSKEASNTPEAGTELRDKVTDLASKIETNKSNITAKNSEIEGQQSSIRDMERSYNDPTSQAYNTYAQLISELGTTRSTNNKSITELEANLGIATGQDKAYTISATSDGVLHYLTPLKQGMSIQQNQTIAEISGTDKAYYVESYVLASDISRVSKGAIVDVAITGVNSQKYGTLKGKVKQLDSGTTTQETKEGSISLYKVIIELETLALNHEGETISLQKGMPAEVRIVYDKETYLDWMLEMLHFK